MIKLIQVLIRKRNPTFSFDKSVTTVMLISLVFEKLVSFLRGLVVFLLHFKKPGLIFLGANVRFYNIHNMRFGKWIKIDPGVYLSALGRHRLEIGDSVGIGANSQIIISTSFNNIGEYIRIGNNVGIGQFASLGGSGGLTIGDNCIIGQYFSCHPENHNFENLTELIKKQGTTRGAIMIGEDCWIGAKVTILAGVEVGAHSVIAAGAVVTKSMPAYSIIGGVPAKVIKSRKAE